MHRWISSAVLALILLVSSANARGSFELTGEALFFRPSVCGLNFASTEDLKPLFDQNEEVPLATAAPASSDNALCPLNHWGFRLGATYLSCHRCTDATLLFSRLSCRSQTELDPHCTLLFPSWGLPEKVGSPLFWGNASFPSPIGFAPLFARSQVKFTWDAVDLELGARSKAGCRLATRGHLGLHYADLKLRHTAQFVGTGLDGAVLDRVHSIDELSKTWGIGPRAGIEGRYEVAKGLGAVAHFAVGFLGGCCRNTFTEIDFAQATGVGVPGNILTKDLVQCDPIDAHSDAWLALLNPDLEGVSVTELKQRSRYLIFPEFDARLGINYHWPFCRCFCFDMEVGYEFRTYLKALRRGVFQQTGLLNSEQCENTSLDGIYIQLSLQF